MLTKKRNPRSDLRSWVKSPNSCSTRCRSYFKRQSPVEHQAEELRVMVQKQTEKNFWGGDWAEESPKPEKWLKNVAKDPNKVIAFCTSHGLTAYLKKAVELVDESFTTTLCKQELRIEETEDEDGEGRWDHLVVDVTIADEVDSFMVAYKKCIAAWATTIPPEALSRMSLSYHLS